VTEAGGMTSEDGSLTDAPSPLDGTTSDGMADTGAGGGDGTVATSYFGKVLFEYFETASTPIYDLLVEVAPTGTLSPATACPSGALVSGSCCYLPAALPDAGAEPFVSAGTMTLLDNGAALVTLPYGAQGYDANDAALSGSWSAGDVLSVSAPGATASAFSGEVGAPADLALVGQALTATVSVSADWTVRWTPGTKAGAQIVADLLSSADGDIKCIVDDSAGAVTLPASLLGKVKSTDTGTLLIARVVDTTASAANATFEIAAFSGVDVTVTFGP
jgi:hypothetical protein